MKNKKLTWLHLSAVLPLINVSQLERNTGLRPRRIADVKAGKSTLTDAELERIRKELSNIV
jgi:hypothetical protein